MGKGINAKTQSSEGAKVFNHKWTQMNTDRGKAEKLTTDHGQQDHGAAEGV